MGHVKNSDNDLADDEFVVARIAGMKVEDDVRYYLIEWEGYDLMENTWEEENNVYSTQTIERFLSRYRKQTHTKNDTSLSNLSRKILLYDTYDPDTKSYFPSRSNNSVMEKHNHTSSTVASMKPDSIQEVRCSIKTMTIHHYRSSHSGGQNNTSIQKSVDATRMLQTYKKMDRDLEKSKAFQEFTDIIKRSVQVNFPIVQVSTSLHKNIPLYQIHNLKTRITIWNEIDLELPSGFIYIDDLKYTDPVLPPDPNFLSGCVCSESSNCGHDCHDSPSYDEHGRLTVNQGVAIYECNNSCECGVNCKNRVVQKGRSIPLQIFKTYSKGWGVRSTQFIPKGTYVEQYIGEVITVEEGDARGALYDRLGCSYLFDMDFAQSELPTKYVIDSYVLGNVSRFFNHSCSPNLGVYAVFYDSADNQLHRLAFFAKRDIQINEELCFDYNGRRDVSNQHDIDGVFRYSCQCGTSECRRWIYQ